MTESTSEMHNELAVFEHEKRREWGLGIIAWEKTSKRGYLFENGQLRILAQEFYPMMREVDRPHDEVLALYDALRPELEAARNAEGIQPRSTRQAAATMTFDDQLSVFRAEYPGGFEDPAWIESQRGTDAKKRLSRHRDAAIAQARAKLGAEDLKSRLAQQQYRSICDDVALVLKKTDLVPAGELAGVPGEDNERRRVLAGIVTELLHGEGPFNPRFDRFVSSFEKAYGRPPGWQLVTALIGLVYPDEHVVVRPTSFREQAKWMAPRLALPKTPTALGYTRCMSMTKLVWTKLTESAEVPRDLMDVYDFIRVTTRPAAKQVLANIKKARAKLPPSSS